MNSKRSRYLRKIAITLADRDPHKNADYQAKLRNDFYRDLKKHWNVNRELPGWAR